MDVNSFYEPLTGVGWYLHQILAHLADRDDLRLRLYGQSLTESRSRRAEPGAVVVAFPAGPAIERVVYAAPDGLVVPPWRADQILRRLAPLLMVADGNDVLFAPNYLFPPLFRFAAGERVAKIHDLGVLKVPWAVRPDSGVALRERLERTLFAADLLLTPSEAVRRELIVIAGAGVSPGRVRAIHHGPGTLSDPRNRRPCRRRRRRASPCTWGRSSRGRTWRCCSRPGGGCGRRADRRRRWCSAAAGDGGRRRCAGRSRRPGGRGGPSISAT